MSFSRTRVAQIFVDGLVILLAFALAYAMRFEGAPPRIYVKQFLLVAPYLVLLRLGLYMAFGVYRLVWRYIGLQDLPRIIGALVAGTLALILLRLSLPLLLSSVGLVFNHAFSRIPFGVMAVCGGRAPLVAPAH
ncbi:MAG: hypothetical protein JRH20_32960 [Deltaproteobacteria bacterium]|nr:hypothetical protein [Deltaproteobacteria bacterium]